MFTAPTGPATLRITVGARYFQPGPFSLGWWAYPCGIVSTLWWIFSLIVFSFPSEFPVTGDNFNSAPVTLAGVLLLAAGWYWLPVIGARGRFEGPAFDVNAFEARVMSGEGEGAEGAAAAARPTKAQDGLVS